jgi:hypothetical protein
MVGSLGTAEERERRIGELHLENVRRRKSQARKLHKTLENAFSAGLITAGELRRLAQQDYEAPVISLYLNFSPKNVSRGDHPVFLAVFDSLRHQELERRKAFIEALSRDRRFRLQEDLAEVGAFLQTVRPEGARSMVLFKSGRQLNRGMSVPVRLVDSLTIDPDPFLEPLETVLEANHRVLTIQLSKEGATLSIYHLGVDEIVDSVKPPVPLELVRTARSKDQAQRHRETLLQWHFESVAQLAYRLFRELECDLVALVGEQSLLDSFDEFLHRTLRDRLLVKLSPSPEQTRAEWRSGIEAALDRRREQEETAALTELGRYRAHGRLAAGLEDVIEPVNLLLARQLFVSPELQRPGWVCKSHHYLSLQPGRCVFDGTELASAENVIDELIEVARLHGVDVMLIEKRQDLLQEFGGVAAITLPVAPQ